MFFHLPLPFPLCRKSEQWSACSPSLPLSSAPPAAAAAAPESAHSVFSCCAHSPSGNSLFSPCFRPTALVLLSQSMQMNLCLSDIHKGGHRGPVPGRPLLTTLSHPFCCLNEIDELTDTDFPDSSLEADHLPSPSLT